jgi:SAM-dependent methyltransferase
VPAELPLPPLELRELVGGPPLEWYDNPTGEPIFPGLPDRAWDCYLDFGCGCGRSARRLIQQDPRPRRYIGVDLHRGMVQWCRENLAPHAEGFEFLHHDVYSPCLNPDPLRPWVAPLPVEDGVCTLIEATSVFTHLVEGQAEHYLDEIARVLAADGRMHSTWFLFDKGDFPYMQDSQNALYINDRDPTNAVAYDRGWLQAALASRDLMIESAVPPSVRGFHWVLAIVPVTEGAKPAVLAADAAPPGRRPPPLVRDGAAGFGLDGALRSAPAAVRARTEPPPPNPLAAELHGAKEYIASLETHMAALQEHAAALEAQLAAARAAALTRRPRL